MQNISKECTAFIFKGQTVNEEQQVIIQRFLILEALYVMNLNSHLICFSEHHIKDMHLNTPHIPMYKLSATYSRNILKCGGICIYIKDSIEHYTINLNDYCKEQDLETVALKFKFNENKCIILCVY
jgi:hypothetical protein